MLYALWWAEAISDLIWLETVCMDTYCIVVQHSIESVCNVLYWALVGYPLYDSQDLIESPT